MASPVKCSHCDTDVGDHFHTCDEEPDKISCCRCFQRSECLREHDVTCGAVFDRLTPDQERLYYLTDHRVTETIQ